MKDFVITATSTCDLTKKYIEENNIKYIPFNYSVDGVLHKDNFYSDITKKEFFNLLSDHEVKTSQPSPNDYYETWKNLAKENKDILHLEMSSGLSGGYNSALIARDMIKDEYKDLNVEIVDSRCASSGFGFLVQLAVENKKKFDMSLIKLKEYLDEIKLNIRHILFTNDLTQYYKGGRVSSVSYVIGKFLNICPIIEVNKECLVGQMLKARGFTNAINMVVDRIKNTAFDGINYAERFLISDSDCPSLVDQTLNVLKSVFTKADFNKTNVYDIGTVMGTHTGRGTVAIFYLGSERT